MVLNVRKMDIYFSLFYILTATTWINCANVASKNGDCIFSFVVPQDSIKQMCKLEQPQTLVTTNLDTHLREIKHDINALKTKESDRMISELNARITNMKDIERYNQRITKLESDTIANIEKRVTAIEETLVEKKREDSRLRSQNSFQDVLGDTTNRRKMVKLIKLVSRREVASIKNQIREEIKSEFLQAFDSSKRKGRITLGNKVANRRRGNPKNWDLEAWLQEIDRDNLEESEMLSDDNVEHDTAKDDSNSFKERLKILLRITTSETAEAATDNEVPEKQKGASVVNTQADSQYGNGVRELLKRFEYEQQTIIRKMINPPLNNVTKRISRIEAAMTGMRSRYNGQLLQKASQFDVDQLNGRMTKIEKEILSLKDDFFSDPKIKQAFQHEKDKLEEKLKSDIDAPLRYKIQQIKSAHDEHKHHINEVKRFNATLRLKLIHLENNITNVVDTLTSVSAKCDKKAEQETESIDLVQEIQEIQKEWPEVVHNLTSLQDLYHQDLDNIQLYLNNMELKFDRLRQNQTMLMDEIKQVKHEMKAMQQSLSKNGLDIKVPKSEDKKKSDWVEYNFKYNHRRSACTGGKRYIKSSNFTKGAYVGVELCSNTRYKILLSESLDKTFFNIGDTSFVGEDHCEFVGGDRRSDIKVGHPTVFRRITGYKRADWGNKPIKGKLHIWNPSPPWYECGVTIP